MEQVKVFGTLEGNLTSFQQNLHKNLNEDSVKEDITTPFLNQFDKSTYYYQYSEKMKLSENNDVFIYKAKHNAHCLLHSDLTQELPSIECMDGYTAKWDLNIGRNIIESGNISLNDEVIQNIHYLTNHIHDQSMINDKDKKINDINIGNISSLQNFSKILHSYDLSYSPPFFYNTDASKSAKLYYLSYNDRFEHKFILRRQIEDLLIIHDSDGNKVDLNDESIYKIGGVTLSDKNILLPLPQLWGHYGHLTEEECFYNKNNSENNKDMFYIEDSQLIELPNPSSLGKNVDIQIKNSEFPILRLAWFAQNQTSLENNNYFNFTTNSENCFKGYSPIKSTTLNNGAINLWKDYPQFRVERVLPKRQFVSTPMVPGIGLLNLGVDCNNSIVHPSTVIKDGSFSAKLTDTNPNLQFDSSMRCKDNFRLYLVLTVLKCIKFDEYPKTEKERHKKNCTIEIIGNS